HLLDVDPVRGEEALRDAEVEGQPVRNRERVDGDRRQLRLLAGARRGGAEHREGGHGGRRRQQVPPHGRDYPASPPGLAAAATSPSSAGACSRLISRATCARRWTNSGSSFVAIWSRGRGSSTRTISFTCVGAWVSTITRSAR